MADLTWVADAARLFARRSLFLCSTICCLAQTGSNSLPADERPLPPSPKAAPEPAGDVRDAWHHTLIRERNLEVRLRAASRQLQAGDVHAGLTNLQNVLNRADDGFVRIESDSAPVGAHRVANRMLSALPPDALRLYQVLYGAEADQLLTMARDKSDFEVFGQIVRRFYHTAAGFEACDWLATKWMDHGAYALAAANWQRILNEPVHQQRVRPSQRLKAAYCFRKSGEVRQADELLRQLQDVSVKVAGKTVQPAAWLAQAASDRSGRTEAADAPVVGGGPDRNRVVSGSAPLLSRPVWTVQLAGAQSRHVEQMVNAWEGYQLQNSQPLGASHFPLVAGGSVVFRDFEGIRAVDLATGAPRWSYSSTSALCRDIPPQTDPVKEGNPDPGNLMRFLVANGTLGMLSSDGRRVFAIDQLESNWNQQTASTGSGQAPDIAVVNRQTNTLVALDLAHHGAAQTQPLWVLGGPVDAQPAPLGLAGHFFLGPPLPVGDLLYAVTEVDRQLTAVCIKPGTGKVVWSQELCSVSLPIHSDQPRYYLPCPLSYADGVLVCPTQAGVLVGIDAVAGTLLWAYAYDDPQQRLNAGMWPNSVFAPKGHAGYPNLPLIQGGSVVFLPAHSEEAHCIDLHTGKSRWRVRREDMEQATATEYVAAASDSTVMVVGRRRCRGLSLATGAEQWSIRLGSCPSGRGTRIGQAYLVPLAEGRIVNVDIDTGRRIGFSLPRTGKGPGNLAVCGDLLISMGPGEISAFPQAAPLLDRMVALTSTAPMQTEQNLLAAELELLLGESAAARSRLQGILQESSDGTVVAEAELLLRELLFCRLPVESEGQEELLDQLDQLARTPAERGRYLFQRADFEQRRGNLEAALAAARELVALDLKTPLALDDDPSRSIAVDAWVRSLLARIWAQADNLQLVRLSSQIDADVNTALESKDLKDLRSLAFVYAGWPQVERARLELARRVLERGEYQEAELLLLEGRTSDAPAVAGEATRMLAEMWSDRGLYHEAALLLAELGTRFAANEVAPGRTGAEFLARFPRDRLAWDAYRRLSADPALGTRVKISEQRWLDERINATYNGNGMQFQTMPRGSSFDLVDKGQGVEGQLALVDRHSGVEFPDVIKVPSRYYPLVPQQFIGHFFPLGTPGAVHGVSVLERKLVWGPTTLAAGSSSSDPVRVGPAGPGFCTFQHRPHLFVLDPSNGRLLWQQNDLDAMAGLMTDLVSGLFGDSQVLTLFAADRSNYTVYDTATGAELRRGKLEIDQRTRRVFGRLLFYISSSATSRRLRIWDPLTDRNLLDEPAENVLDASLLAGVSAGTKLFTFLSQADELAYITSTGRLRVIDVRTGATRLDAPLDPEQLVNLGSIRAFSDQDRYYVNLHRYPVPGDAVSENSYIASDMLLPVVNVQGDLCAVDRRTQQVVWSRPFANRSVLQLPDYHLPVLIGVCRIRRGDRLSVQVDVVDSRTGNVIASRDGLLADRIVQLSYDRDLGRIELRGARTEIRLQFGNTGEPANPEDDSAASRE